MTKNVWKKHRAGKWLEGLHNGIDDSILVGFECCIREAVMILYGCLESTE